ncbi:hypothetical protein [uncultured Rothia sp.]|uniref:hypothetical protein n=1 Tax=uncultured Rothia sp. TaxID=316088 RepID=UPI00288BDA3E|nr:hypothetical protein [uncultured Rothia sp.]
MAEKKSRKLAPCGTTAAAKRHRRRGEAPCPECRAAERAASKAARDRKAAERPPEPVISEAGPAPAVRTVGQSDVVVIEQVGAYGAVREVPVPTHEDPLESARWRLYKARAALIVAGPRDVAALLNAEREAAADIAQLSEAVKPKMSALDELAARRKRRIEEAQAV